MHYLRILHIRESGGSYILQLYMFILIYAQMVPVTAPVVANTLYTAAWESQFDLGFIFLKGLYDHDG